MNITKEEVISFIDNINFNRSTSLNEGMNEFQKIILELINNGSYDAIELIITVLKNQNAINEKLLNYLDSNNMLDSQSGNERFVLRGKISGIKSLLFTVQEKLLISRRDDLCAKYFPQKSEDNSRHIDSQKVEKFPEFTHTRHVLAMMFMLDKLGVKPDKNLKNIAKFIQFFNKANFDNLYENVRNIYNSPDNWNKEDLSYIKKFFDIIGLETISKTIENEILE